MVKNLSSFSLKSGTSQRSLLVPLLFNIILGGLSHCNKTREKGKPDWKGGNKLSVITNNMIVYVENPLGPPKNLQELIKEFKRVVGHKINIQIPTVFTEEVNRET